ncbi:hypothetical protein D3C78_1468750 [compost metagenome]
MAPEIEVVGISPAERRQLVVADACIFIGEIARPIHKAVGWCGHHQFIDAPFGHQLATAGVAHARQDVGLRFGICRGLGRLLGAEGKVPHGQPLHLHERSPELVTVQHAFGQQMSVDINQHGVLLIVISQRAESPIGGVIGLN